MTFDTNYKPPVYPGARLGTLRQDGTIGANDQWLRKWELTVVSSGEIGRAGAGVTITTQEEHHDFRMTFRVRAADGAQTSPTAEIRVYNLSKETARHIIREHDRVILQAGYVTGHYGIIFTGRIKYFKVGRESAVDAYLDIFAASADELNDAWFNKSIEGPIRDPAQVEKDELKRVANEHVKMLEDGDQAPPSAKVTQLLPRDLVLYGGWKSELREWERSTFSTFHVQNDKLQILPRTAYNRGDIVVINAGTGMVGVPEVTTDGINLQCLLNPNLYVKGRVKLDNRTFNTYYVPGGNLLAGQPGAQAGTARVGLGAFMAPITEDGVYTIISIDHSGDTRGQAWYSHLMCTHQHPDRVWDQSVTAGDWRPT